MPRKALTDEEHAIETRERGSPTAADHVTLDYRR
jgi:hypothetical protein